MFVAGDFDNVALGEMSIHGYTAEMYRFGLIMARFYLPSKEIQALVHSDQKFDAVMFESNFYQEYLTPLIHKFDAIGIEIVTLGTNNYF